VTRRTAALLAALTVAAAAGVLFGPEPVRIAGGVLIGLTLPGVALTAALFRNRIALTAVERIMLAPALSLATLVLGGLAAWATGLPLGRDTWLAVGGLVTLVALATTVIWPVAVPVRPRGRTVKLPTAGDPTLILPVFLDRQRAALPRWRRLLPARPQHTVLPLALAVALLGGASWLSVSTSVDTHDVTVTSLSAAMPSGPDSRGQRSVTVRATGLGSGAGAYALVVTSATGTERTERALTADADGNWHGTVTVPGAERTTIGLYRAGDTAPARTVVISANSN
jgi:hypothetical protein